MNALAVLSEALAQGLTLEAEGQNIAIVPKSRLTPDLRARIVAAKPEILALLKTCTLGKDSRSTCPAHAYVHGRLLKRDPCAGCGRADWIVALVDEGDVPVCPRCLAPEGPTERSGASWPVQGATR